MESAKLTEVLFTTTWNGILCAGLFGIVICLLQAIGICSSISAGFSMEVADKELKSLWQQYVGRVVVIMIMVIPNTMEVISCYDMCDTIQKFDIRTTRLGNEDDRPKLLQVLRLMWPQTAKLLSQEEVKKLGISLHPARWITSLNKTTRYIVAKKFLYGRLDAATLLYKLPSVAMLTLTAVCAEYFDMCVSQLMYYWLHGEFCSSMPGPLLVLCRIIVYIESSCWSPH